MDFVFDWSARSNWTETTKKKIEAEKMKKISSSVRIFVIWVLLVVLLYVGSTHQRQKSAKQNADYHWVASVGPRRIDVYDWLLMARDNCFAFCAQYTHLFFIYFISGAQCLLEYDFMSDRWNQIDVYRAFRCMCAIEQECVTFVFLHCHMGSKNFNSLSLKCFFFLQAI